MSKEHEEEMAKPITTTVRTGMGGLTHDKAQVLSRAMGASLRLWLKATEHRFCIIEIPYEPMFPVWVMRAVLDAAPGDAMITGMTDAFASGHLGIRVRSATFPEFKHDGSLQAPRVKASWDWEAQTVTAEWPQRSD